MNTDNSPEDALDLGARVDAFVGGQKLLNRYKLARVLGHGGMGVVWLARDEELERDVAMKFLPAIVVNDRAGLTELKRETKRSLELTHPNIVRIYDFVQDNSIAGISMEYVECDTLRNRRLDQPSGVFEAAELGPWIRQLCSALDYAHGEAAIVHRDLKPANLMINARDHLKVTDFGISRSLVESVSQISFQRNISGTLVYMSPQQLAGERPTPSDDVYALGATLYELMTSRSPFFSGDIPGQVQGKTPPLMRHRRESFGIHAGEIPDNWETVVAACLAKEPLQRPRSAGDVAVRLGLCAAADITMLDREDWRMFAAGSSPTPPSQVAAAVPISPPRRALFSRRNVLAGALAGAIALAGASVWYQLQYLPRRAERLAAARGSIVVKTEPSGATVMVGDAPPQQAPAVFGGLKLGSHSVQIEREGYEPKTISAEVEENRATDLGTVSLFRSKGSLRITTNPDGLACEVRSESNPFQPVSGKAPMELKDLDTGNYEVKVSRLGWPTQTRSCVVSRGPLRQVFFDFAGGEITIVTTPPGALVFRDKEQLGVTPLPIKDHPPGEVKYMLTLAGYENAVVQGNVQPGQSLALSETLKKIRPKTAQNSPRRSDSASSRNKDENEERSERIKRAFIPYYDVFRK
ncbi:MAG TPA: serine/threonine-protein kinase [Chthoniobacterales bacterium]|nr:serine/threonine-protein kinase [Chthoniobacterales bacterium]